MAAMAAVETSPAQLSPVAELAPEVEVSWGEVEQAGNLNPIKQENATAANDTESAKTANVNGEPAPVEALSYKRALSLLDSIPGVSQRIAEIILAEIGLDMQRFGDAQHLSSWVGICPGNRESGGKRLSGRTRKGNRWLKQALTEAGQAAMRTKNSYLSAQGKRISARRGRKRAILAVGHSILTIVYYLLSRNKTYEELGENYFEERDRKAVERQAIKRLEKLGYRVRLEASIEKVS